MGVRILIKKETTSSKLQIPTFLIEIMLEPVRSFISVMASTIPALYDMVAFCCVSAVDANKQWWVNDDSLKIYTGTAKTKQTANILWQNQVTTLRLFNYNCTNRFLSSRIDQRRTERSKNPHGWNLLNGLTNESKERFRCKVCCWFCAW